MPKQHSTPSNSTGPNAPNISSSKKGGAGNGQTTPESAKKSYKKPKGG